MSEASEKVRNTERSECFFAALYDRAVEDAVDGAQFLEIGVGSGVSTCYLARKIADSKKLIRLDVLERWGAGEYEKFIFNTLSVAHLINHVNCRSNLQVHADFYDDRSLDFVMLGGGGDYATVFTDIMIWKSKVKPGGVLAGADFNMPGVCRAVYDSFVKKQVVRSAPTGGRVYRYWSVRL